MMNYVVALLLVALAAVAHAQKGSVHCGVGCACATDKEPACANNGVTYLNECELRCAQCDLPGLLLVHPGVCAAGGVVYTAPAPVVYTAPAPVVYTAPAATPVVYTAPAPVVYTAPAPAVPLVYAGR